ncbi:ATP-binding protein [Neisseria zalophi]|uniref:ATP-binding protein n=1 Tax=Neisseria zalophi TaxID=640030 RepID=A0A5J6PY20_9NEIS|nr:ATP-binding protein [Neisseria zalophi]QEY25670.1 ATP-binding protein [Neisseria zalophi]
MDINLKVAAPRLFPQSRFEMVYFEAVANALDAQATEINIEIEMENSNLEKFIIKDNGIGLNEENYWRFSELMEAKDNVHKGQGRLVYLLYFDDIKITSQFLEGDTYQQRSFNFNDNFKKENHHLIKNIKEYKSGTTLSFNGKRKKMRTNNSLDANYIREQIFAEFLPCFFEMKQENKNFQINIKSKLNEEQRQTSINVKDIPDFQSIEIDATDLLEEDSNNAGQKSLLEPTAKLYYFLKSHDIKSNISSVVTSFAIDNRAKKIDIIDVQNYLPNVEAIFFLVSKHFEGCVDPTRQELTLKPEHLKRVKNIFRNKVKDILKNNFSEYQNILHERQSFLWNRFPHLIDYIDLSEIGFKANRDIVQDAQNQFFKEQRDILEKDKLTESDYIKALDLSAKNLLEYILFRQLQIKKLKSIGKEDREETIHNIISPMRTTYSSGHNNDLFNNNAWILDDRFMTYIQAASDTTLKDITEKFDEIFYQSTKSKSRPDYLMFFSNKITHKSDKVDLVCFEFKRLGTKLEENTKAITELTKYIKQLKDVCEKIQRVWLYALVNFDQNLEESLESQDFKMKFSTQGKIWYRYYENIGAELAFLDFEAVVSDADSRNKTFMEILKNGFSYNE